MKKWKWQDIIYNCCIVLNCLLVFLLIFDDRVKVPLFLQVFGRAHPLVLHFPIVLLLLAVVFEAMLISSKQPLLKQIADWLLLAAVFTTVIAALMGLFLSKEGGYKGNDIVTHKWMGVLCALIACAWYGLRNTIRKRKAATVLMGLSASLSLLIAGHVGGGITHGDDFLLSPMMDKNKKPNILLDDAVVYTHVIQPILQQKCMGCHNSSKAKGELVMETKELLLKGGKNGKLWDTAAPQLGLMMQRIHLPVQDEKHMAPEGKEQLTTDEIRLLQLWIKGGASFTQKVVELPASDSLRMIAASFFKNGDEEVYDFPAVDAGTVAGLNTEYRIIKQLATGSPALDVSFFGASKFNSSLLKDLEKIKNNIVSLYLVRMPVTDEDLKIIGGFSNLRELNLSFTNIKGDGLKYLTSLQNLKEIAVSGTAVKSADIRALAPLKSLKKIECWNTEISKNDLASLQKSFPKVSLNIGAQGLDTMVVKLNTPIMVNESQVFGNETLIQLKMPVKAAQVRYTIDGSDPDSLTSPVYKEPVKITKTTTFKAKAYLKNWTTSDMLTRVFTQGTLLPDSVRLITQPQEAYRGKANGGKALFDRKTGGLVFSTGGWIGYRGRNNPLEAYLYFYKPAPVSSLTFRTLINTPSQILPPVELQVWGGSDTSHLQLLSTLRPAQLAKAVDTHIENYTCTFPVKTMQVLKVVARPIPELPLWIAKKPESLAGGWIFFDEILLN